MQLQQLRPHHNRIANGMPLQTPAKSLDGFADVHIPEEDPLAILAREREELQKQKREQRRKQ